MLQPYISYQFKSTVWRLEIDAHSQTLFAEIRDQDDKKVFFGEKGTSSENNPIPKGFMTVSADQKTYTLGSITYTVTFSTDNKTMLWAFDAKGSDGKVNNHEENTFILKQ